MIAPEFLDLEEVLEIHALQLDEFGGIAGVRDRGLLESAVEQPRATAFGELLHADLSEMAAPAGYFAGSQRRGQSSSVTRHVDSHDGCRRAREKRSPRQRALVAEDRWVSFGSSLDGAGLD